MDNTDRAQWIDNDEGLYNWWRMSKQSKAAFMKENRVELDAAINNARHPCRSDCYACKSGVGSHEFRSDRY